MIYQKLHTIDNIHFFKYDDSDRKIDLLDAVVDPSKYIIYSCGEYNYLEFIYIRFDKIKKIIYEKDKSSENKMSIYLLDDNDDNEYHIFKDINISDVNKQIRNFKLKELLDN